MLILAMRPAANDTAAEEVVITTPSGEEIVVVLLRASGKRNGEQVVGFGADPTVKIDRRPLQTALPTLRSKS